MGYRNTIRTGHESEIPKLPELLLVPIFFGTAMTPAFFYPYAVELKKGGGAYVPDRSFVAKLRTEKTL